MRQEQRDEETGGLNKKIQIPRNPFASNNQRGSHAFKTRPSSLSNKSQKGSEYKTVYGDSVTFGVKIFPEQA